jgi:hypothetical protein
VLRGSRGVTWMSAPGLASSSVQSEPSRPSSTSRMRRPSRRRECSRYRRRVCRRVRSSNSPAGTLRQRSEFQRPTQLAQGPSTMRRKRPVVVHSNWAWSNLLTFWPSCRTECDRYILVKPVGLRTCLQDSVQYTSGRLVDRRKGFHDQGVVRDSISFQAFSSCPMLT